MSISRGVPVVVSAPSGAGKTTLCRRVMAELGKIEFSVSYTTRPPRGNEVDGKDYHFVSREAFDAKIAEGDFLEWADVHGKRYGSGRTATEAWLSKGYDVFFDIDYQGGFQIRDALPDAVLIFIVPPNLEVLETRLRGRETDSEDEILRRLSKAKEEIAQAKGYDYWICNDDLDDAAKLLSSILKAERNRRLDKQEVVSTWLAQSK